MSQPIRHGEVRNSEYVSLYIQFLDGEGKGRTLNKHLSSRL